MHIDPEVNPLCSMGLRVYRIAANVWLASYKYDLGPMPMPGIGLGWLWSEENHH